MMFKILLFLLAGHVVLAFKEVPEIFHVCPRNIPSEEYNQCFMNSALALKPHLARGMPEYRIPSIEPFEMESMVISDVNTPIFSLFVTFKNLKVHGASNFGVRFVNVDFGTSLTTFEFMLPDITVVGDYRTVGKIFSIYPVEIHGRVTGRFSHMSARCRMVTQIKTINGTSFIRIRSMMIKSHVGGGSVHLQPMHQSQSMLIDSINAAVNRNFHRLVGGVSYEVESQLAKLMRAATNDILSQFSYHELFPSIDL